MHPKLSLLATLLIASPLAAKAACPPTRSVSKANNQDLKILVPFAVPIGLPVATFAPYFYSASQFQSSLPPATDNGRRKTDIQTPNYKSPTTDLITTHCSSCHSGPSPKASLSLDRPDSLPLADRLRAIRAVASTQMPKGTQLTDEQIRALIQELSQR